MTRGFAALAVFVGVSALIPALPVQAGLGRGYGSVDTDRLMLSAKINSTSASGYTLHTLALANHGVVREFTRADGMVFAVTWRGPGRPNLRQLLGDSFDTLQADTSTRLGRRARRPLAVSRSDLVIQSGGHPGAFWGAAMIPSLEPAGFTIGDLK